MSSENNSSSPTNIEKCSIILVDVAGTTTSINFVKDTLFPLVIKQAGDFIKSKWEQEDVKECVKNLKEAKDLDATSAADLIKSLTEKESDNEHLKTIQGLIYKDCYEDGSLKAHVFDDVPAAFESWAKSRRIAVYSTGSIESQKLLFTHTVHGDISGSVSKYFDQQIGAKTDSNSYRNIAKDLEVTPEEMVFITDSSEEAKAAKSAGVNVFLVTREGNAEIAEETAKEYSVISSFKDIVLDTVGKRKIEEESVSAEEPPSKLAKTEEVAKDATADKEEKMETDTPPEVIESEKSGEQENSVDPTKTEETSDKTELKDEESKTEDKDTKSKDEVPKKMETDSSETENTETKKTENTEAKETENTETKETVAEVKENTSTEEKVKDVTVEAVKEPEKVATETEKQAAEVEEEVKVDVEDTEKSEDKVSEESVKEKVDGTTKAETEASEAPAAVEETSEAAKTDEKENKSVLANGVENGNKEEDVTENNADPKGAEEEVKNDEIEKQSEDEVKVKKLDEGAESNSVSVEV